MWFTGERRERDWNSNQGPVLKKYGYVLYQSSVSSVLYQRINKMLKGNLHGTHIACPVLAPVPAPHARPRSPNCARLPALPPSSFPEGWWGGQINPEPMKRGKKNLEPEHPCLWRRCGCPGTGPQSLWCAVTEPSLTVTLPFTRLRYFPAAAGPQKAGPRHSPRSCTSLFGGQDL